MLLAVFIAMICCSGTRLATHKNILHNIELALKNDKGNEKYLDKEKADTLYMHKNGVVKKKHDCSNTAVTEDEVYDDNNRGVLTYIRSDLLKKLSNYNITFEHIVTYSDESKEATTQEVTFVVENNKYVAMLYYNNGKQNVCNENSNEYNNGDSPFSINGVTYHAYCGMWLNNATGADLTDFDTIILINKGSSNDVKFYDDSYGATNTYRIKYAEYDEVAELQYYTKDEVDAKLSNIENTGTAEDVLYADNLSYYGSEEEDRTWHVPTEMYMNASIDNKMSSRLRYGDNERNENKEDAYEIPTAAYVDDIVSGNATSVHIQHGLHEYETVDAAKIEAWNCDKNKGDCNTNEDNNEIIFEFPTKLNWGSKIVFTYNKHGDGDDSFFNATLTLVDNTAVENVECEHNQNDKCKWDCICDSSATGILYDAQNNKLRIWSKSGTPNTFEIIRVGNVAYTIKCDNYTYTYAKESTSDITIIGSTSNVPAMDTLDSMLSNYMQKQGVKNITKEYGKEDGVFKNGEYDNDLYTTTIEKLTDKSDYYVTIWVYDEYSVNKKVTFHMSNGAVASSDPSVDEINGKKEIWLYEELQNDKVVWKLHILQNGNSPYYSSSSANYYVTCVTHTEVTDTESDYYTKYEADSRFANIPKHIYFNNNTEQGMNAWKLPTVDKVSNMISDYFSSIPTSTPLPPLPSFPPSSDSGGGFTKLKVEHDSSKANVAHVSYDLRNKHVLLCAHVLDNDDKVVDSYMYDGVLAFASDDTYVDDVNRYYDITVSYSNESNDNATLRITKSKSNEDAAVKLVVDYCIVIT